MASGQTPPVADILSAQEMAALDFAHNLYGAETKLAAGVLADTVELDKPLKTAFIDGVATRIENMDFEQRRTAALKLRETAAALGGPAVESALDLSGQLDEVVLHNGNAGLIYESRRPAEAAGSEEHEEPHEPDSQERAAPLLPTQITWLGKFLDEDGIAAIEQLSLAGRASFAAKLSDRLNALRIRGLSPNRSETRSIQISAIISGSSYEEIAQLTDSKTRSTYSGMGVMATTISKNIPLSDIKEMVAEAADTSVIPEEILDEEGGDNPEPAEASDEEGGTSQELVELTKSQRNWFGKFLNEEDVSLVEGLLPHQRQYLAELLAGYLRSFVIRRDGPFKTDRRVTQMIMLITGHDLEEIANTTGQDSQAVKAEFHNTAGIFSRRLGDTDYSSILRRAVAYTIE